MPADNIWDAAIELNKQKREDPNAQKQQRESTLLIVGSKGVGKVGNSVLKRGAKFKNIVRYSPVAYAI